jgi:raffinose/stachyose/melibiose transport system substrate-binding protein
MAQSIQGEHMKKVLITAGLALASCGAFVAFAQKTTLTIWVLNDIAPHFKEVAAEFEKTNPNVTITVRDYPNEAYKTAIQVGVASNQPPDIFFNEPGETAFKFVRDDQVMDLTATAKKAGWDKTLKGTVGAFTLDGKIWGMPYTQQSKYYYYSKEIFAREKIRIPSSFNALLNTCKTLKAKGIVPISFGNSERWPGIHYMTILNQKVVGDAQIAADYSLKPAEDKLFTDPAYATALQKLKDMQDAGCFNNAVNSVSPEIARATFYSGKAAMTFCGTWCLGIMDSNGFKGKYGNFRFPRIQGGKGNQDYVISGPSGLQISAKSGNKEAAISFLEYFISAKPQARMVSSTNRIPANPAAVKGLQLEPALAAVIADLGKASGSVLWLDSAVEAGVSDAYLNMIQEVLNGTKTPQQAMEVIRESALVAKKKLGR